MAQLNLSLDLDNYMLTIAGTVPTHEIALDMARRAVDECKRLCDQAWHARNDRSITLPTGLRLPTILRG